MCLHVIICTNAHMQARHAHTGKSATTKDNE